MNADRARELCLITHKALYFLFSHSMPEREGSILAVKAFFWCSAPDFGRKTGKLAQWFLSSWGLHKTQTSHINQRKPLQAKIPALGPLGMYAPTYEHLNNTGLKGGAEMKKCSSIYHSQENPRSRYTKIRSSLFENIPSFGAVHSTCQK